MIYGIWTLCAALGAFLISAVAGKFFNTVSSQLHFGQTILEEGPSWHKSKQGTPTMGGIMFILAIAVVTIISTVFIYLQVRILSTPILPIFPKRAL